MRDRQNKLSKRHGDASYQDFAGKGYLPQAILNYIALLGWSPAGTREIFSLPELVQAFDIAGISRSPAIFDTDKLKWMNAEYIRALPRDAYIRAALPWLERAIDPDRFDLPLIAKITQPRLETFAELPDKLGFLAVMPEYDTELYRHKKMKVTPESALAYIKEACPVLEGLAGFTEEDIHGAMMGLVERLGVRNGQLLYPLRIAITGTAVTPGGAIEIAALLGRGETLERLRNAIGKLEQATA
jgi:glutamyl-tRNA synthetase